MNVDNDTQMCMMADMEKTPSLRPLDRCERRTPDLEDGLSAPVGSSDRGATCGLLASTAPKRNPICPWNTTRLYPHRLFARFSRKTERSDHIPCFRTEAAKVTSLLVSSDPTGSPIPRDPFPPPPLPRGV